MEYVKHKYSGRTYQISREHGDRSIHLIYQDHFGRYVRPDTLKRFFLPCKTPSSREPGISILKEVQWERRLIAREKPLETPQEKKPPKVQETSSQKDTPSESLGYTLKDLCSELGTSPATARKILRSHGKSAPSGGWRWGSAKEARGVKKILKKYL